MKESFDKNAIAGTAPATEKKNKNKKVKPATDKPASKTKKVKAISVTVDAESIEKLGAKVSSSLKKVYIEAVKNKTNAKHLSTKAITSAFNKAFATALPDLLVKPFMEKFNSSQFIQDLQDAIDKQKEKMSKPVKADKKSDKKKEVSEKKPAKKVEKSSDKKKEKSEGK